MDWKAKWIWIEGEEAPKNFWLAARKVINVKDDLKEAKLHITADSRYVVWLNGKRLGQGPVRSWPWDWSYDSYEVKGILCPGRNVISVLVLHYGVSNFQYIESRGGLLAQLDMVTDKDKKVSIGTDRTWKGIPHPSYDRKTMRISCQQGWVEQYNTENEPEGWHRGDFQDTVWKNLKEIGKVGILPWKKLSPRDIPFLTEEPVYPVRILRTRVVKSLNQHFAFNLKPHLLPGDRTANHLRLSGFAGAILYSPRDVKGKIIYSDTGNIAGKLRVNGKDCPRVDENSFDKEGAYSNCFFKKGNNLIIWDVRGLYHNWYLTFSLALPFKANLRPPFSSKKTELKLATLGPIDEADKETFDRIWQAREEADLFPYKDISKPISGVDEAPVNIFAQTTQVEETKQKVRITNPEYLCLPNENIAIIHPSGSADVEILIDFGREIVGFLEFELEAEPGIVLDFNCFEAIQEGKINFTQGLQNVLRYTTRGRIQFYHSVVRRGFRYALLVVRFPKASKKPLKIKFLRCLLNTYPVIERGEFISNDTRLNRIWKMGSYTTRLCSEDTFVDCPAYEQVFWVGDARNEGAVNHVAFGEYALSRRCLLLAAESLKRSPIVESQVPSGWEDILTAWSLLWVLACEEFYRMTGDREFIRKVYPAIVRQNGNLEKMLIGGLVSINTWNMLDWAPMDTPSDAIAVTHQNAWYVESLRRSGRLASILGKKADAKKWLGMAGEVKEAINKRLWDGKSKAYIDCIRGDGTRSPVISQQTNTVIFLCDCATPNRRQIIKNYIATAPANFVKTGSPFMMFFTFEALAKAGDFKEILNLSRKYWGFMLDNGATTCWETFQGLYPDGRWTRSHCHAWSAAPTYFLSTYQLGITPEEPGFRKAMIAPEPAGLKWVRGSMPTPYGRIKVAWRNQRGIFKIEVLLPADVSGKVILPDFISKKARIEISGDIIKKPVFTGSKWQLEVKEKGETVITARY